MDDWPTGIVTQGTGFGYSACFDNLSGKLVLSGYGIEAIWSLESKIMSTLI